MGRIGARTYPSCGNFLEADGVSGYGGRTRGTVDVGHGSSERRHLERRVGIAAAFAADLGGYGQRSICAVVCSTPRVASSVPVVVRHANH